MISSESCRFQHELDDHGTDDSGHERGADEKCIPVLQGCARREFKYEVVVDSCVLPHEQVAAIQEDVQAEKCKHAAGRRADILIRISRLCNITDAIV